MQFQTTLKTLSLIHIYAAGVRDREVHQSREYSQDTGREYGRSRQRYENRFEGDEKRKKKRNKMARYLLGTLSSSALIIGAAGYELSLIHIYKICSKCHDTMLPYI